MMLRAVADAWKRGDTAAAAKAAKAAGLGVTVAQLATLAVALESANSSRKARLLEVTQVLEAIEAAIADTHGVGIVHGGEANDGTQRTTLCLAYRDGATMTVGVGLSSARSPGPGVTWRKLQPWSKVTPDKNVERLRAWMTAKARDRVRFSLGKLATRPVKRTLADEDALLAAVLADPDDDAPRAVFADKLLELDDPRGELIAVQLALAKEPPISGRHAELAKVSAALEKQHAAAWSRAVAQHTLKQRYRRGFIDFIELRAAAFASHGSRLFELAPIETVRLRNVDLPSLKKVAASPALAKLRRLEIDGEIGDRGAHVLAAGTLTSLRELDLDGCGVAAPGIAALLLAAPALERLVLHSVGEAIAGVILSRPKLIVASYTKPRGGKAISALQAARRIVSLDR